MTPLTKEQAEALAGQPKVGDWCIFRDRAGWAGSLETYDYAKVERVTAKTVYARACYRNQHPIDDCIVMQNEEAARLFVDRTKSHRAEADRRINAAREWYRSTIAKALATEIRDGTFIEVQHD